MASSNSGSGCPEDAPVCSSCPGGALDSSSNGPGDAPIRSILKKASNSKSVSSPRPSKKKKRSISFDMSVTVHWTRKDSKVDDVEENGVVGVAVDVASNGEPSLCCSSSVEPRGSLEVAGTDVRPLKGAKGGFKTNFKAKVGNVLRRSGRTQNQGGLADLDVGGSGLDLIPRTCSDASVAHSTAAKSQSLPRNASFDSADLFTKKNKSLRSKVVKFGKYLRPTSSNHRGSDYGVPVLTKVTPLGDTPLRESGDADGVPVAPLAPVEVQDNSDSGSDDEKGGTIKRMPKLRHVSSEKGQKDQVEDDSESRYHQLFEYVFVVSLKEESKGKLTTELTYTFPPTSREFSGKDLALKSIPQFCFPDIDQWKPTKQYKSESYSFVLTDMEGNRRYGYCRRLLPSGSGARLPEVFCIVSPLGCFSLYENILDHVEERRAISSLSVFNFLKAISANPFPRPGRSVEVKVFGAQGADMETLTFTRPLDSRLEHVDFSLLFSTLSQRKIIQLFCSLLMERRVIFCANSLSLTTGCAHALMALLYPFEWQHVFIPVLPTTLIDFVCSPLPYIIGIHPSSCKHFDEMEMEEAVIINLDKGKFLKKIGDETSILPSKLFQFLEGKLSSSIITSEYGRKAKGASPTKADEIVVTTFMTFFAYLYGDYREDLKRGRGGMPEFQRNDYIKRFSSKSTKRFLEAFHMTQMFEHFIEQRETPSKAETLAASLFERKLPELKERCQDIEIFSSKSRFDRWKMKKDLAKAD